MKTVSCSFLFTRLWLLIMLGDCSSCSSILQASRLAIPDAAINQTDASYNGQVQWTMPKEWVIAPDGQHLDLPLLNRPTLPAPMGGQWVFVVKESQANGQINGYWIIVPVGNDLSTGGSYLATDMTHWR